MVGSARIDNHSDALSFRQVVYVCIGTSMANGYKLETNNQ